MDGGRKGTFTPLSVRQKMVRVTKWYFRALHSHKSVCPSKLTTYVAELRRIRRVAAEMSDVGKRRSDVDALSL
jgi:hypothetical protein